MKRYKLSVDSRKVLGKKVKKLRRDGFLPANVYGKDVKSAAVQVPYKEFNQVFEEAGETGLVDLAVDGKTVPVLIHNVQTDYRNNVLHADFYQVNLKEKVKTTVPLEFVGEPLAEVNKVGLLETPVSEVEVEALPEELPENIEVNVAHLAEIDQQITIGELKVAEGVTVLSDPNQVVAKIGELVSKEAQEQAAEEAAAAEAASAEGSAETAEGAEGEAPAEGEAATTEEGPKEEVKENQDQ